MPQIRFILRYLTNLSYTHLRLVKVEIVKVDDNAMLVLMGVINELQ